MQVLIRANGLRRRLGVSREATPCDRLGGNPNKAIFCQYQQCLTPEQEMFLVEWI